MHPESPQLYTKLHFRLLVSLEMIFKTKLMMEIQTKRENILIYLFLSDSTALIAIVLRLKDFDPVQFAL